jgi:hypothetical protein
MSAYTAHLRYEESVAVVVAPDGAMTNGYVFDASVGVSASAALRAAQDEADAINAAIAAAAWGQADEEMIQAAFARRNRGGA